MLSTIPRQTIPHNIACGCTCDPPTILWEQDPRVVHCTALHCTARCSRSRSSVVCFAVCVRGCVLGTSGTYLSPVVDLGNPGNQFDFTMCNPPFFTNMSEANQNPKAAGGGTPSELVTEGTCARPRRLPPQFSLSSFPFPVSPSPVFPFLIGQASSRSPTPLPHLLVRQPL
jgi:hypothetical protein